MPWLFDRPPSPTARDWAVRRPHLEPAGWAFEFANDMYPDIDDTAEVVLALHRVQDAVVASSASQFGTLGLVLAVATWLVGYAGVMVVTATLGRVVAEDAMIRSFVRRFAFLRRWVPGMRSQTGSASGG